MTDSRNIEEVQRQKAFKKWFLDYVKESWFRITILVLLSLVAAALSLLDPWPLKVTADSVFGHVTAPGPLAPYTGEKELLYFIAIIYVLIYVAQSLVTVVSAYLATRFGFKLDIRVKGRLFKHILYLPFKSPDRLEDGDYVYRENVETGTLSGVVLGSFITIFGSVVTVVGVFTVLIILYWQLAILIIAVLPFLIITVKYFGGKIQDKSMAIEEVNSELYTHTQESIENVDIVQAFGRQESQVQKLIEILNKKLKIQLSFNLVLGGFGFCSSVLTVVALVAIMVVGGNAVFDGKLTFGGLLIFVSYVTFLIVPLESISNAYASIRENLASLNRVFDIVHDHESLENVEVGQDIGKVKGEILFQNVNFKYGNKQVLKDVSFSIKPLERVAFIGPSGAGKSTILDLVMRFAIQDSGFIYIDGQEVRNINLNSLRRNIALVDQEPKLFSISVAENIAFAGYQNDKYPLPDIIGAAEIAYANEFINQLPNKYDEKINQTGSSLSGGQKQRIAIARAIYKKAPILLMDEPTSAQDVSSENHVLEAINELIKNRTVLIVTHKFSLLSQMDRVFVVEGGTVQDVKEYGGLDAYSKYLEIHEQI